MSRQKKQGVGASEPAGPRAGRRKSTKREASAEPDPAANQESSRSERLTMQLRRQLAPGQQAEEAVEGGTPLAVSPRAVPPEAVSAEAVSPEAVPEPHAASDEPMRALMDRYSRSSPRLPKASSDT